MRKYINFGFLVLVLGFVPAFAQVDLTAGTDGEEVSNFSSKLGEIGIGFIKEGTREVGNVQWQPDFKLGPIGLGLDVNYPLGQNKPVGYENIVLRYVEYDDSKRGLRYGVLDSVTWGHGLLMKNYSTRTSGPITLNNAQLGLLGYYDFEKVVTRGMWTKTGVYALRLEEKVNPWLTLGQSYIGDSDGVLIPGTAIIQKVGGVGIDATVPLPWNFQGYAEWARLIQYGSGLSTGIGWDYDMMIAKADFVAEYRLLDRNFVPGYYGPDYETDPVNMASIEASTSNKNGYLIQANANVLEIAQASLAYENYNNSNATVKGKLAGKIGEKVTVSGYYDQPNFVDFRSLTLEQGAIMGGYIAYKVNLFTTVITHYKKAYNKTTAQVEESQYYELRFSL